MEKWSFSSGNVVVSDDDAAAVKTRSAVAGQRHVLTGVLVGYDGEPDGGLLTITDGGVTVLSVPILVGGPAPIQFPSLLMGGINSTVVITLAAGGSGVKGYLNLFGHRLV